MEPLSIEKLSIGPELNLGRVQEKEAEFANGLAVPSFYGTRRPGKTGRKRQ
jgi:hypothetical protein